MTSIVLNTSSTGSPPLFYLSPFPAAMYKVFLIFKVNKTKKCRKLLKKMEFPALEKIL